MKIKTSELIGVALDWAVAKAADIKAELIISKGGSGLNYGEREDDDGNSWPVCFDPSTDWAVGGPLIERFEVWLSPPVRGCDPFGWDSEIYGEDDGCPIADQDGCATPLIAACRAIVQAMLGDEVDLPEGLQP